MLGLILTTTWGKLFPNWANALRQLLGNQIDRGTAIDFHVSHRASPVATGVFGGLNPPKQCSNPPPNWNMKTINKCSFVNFYNVKASTGKQKTYSNHNFGWYSPWYHVATSPVWVESTRGWYSSGVSNLCKKRESDQCRQVLHRWHWQLAREPRFVLFWCWTGSTALSGLKFMSSIKCFGLLPQVHAQQGASRFWLRQSSRNFT